MDNQYVSAFMGKDRSHLARLMDVWTFELGRVGKELVGVPHDDYLTATTLAEFEEMGMGECHALGDASDFGCEQPRHPAFAKVANQGHSDKIKSFAARGTHFSTGAGLIIVATSLYFARSSELQGVISLYEDFKKLPKRVQFCYDKGRGRTGDAPLMRAGGGEAAGGVMLMRVGARVGVRARSGEGSARGAPAARGSQTHSQFPRSVAGAANAAEPRPSPRSSAAVASRWFSHLTMWPRGVSNPRSGKVPSA